MAHKAIMKKMAGKPMAPHTVDKMTKVLKKDMKADFKESKKESKNEVKKGKK